MIKRTIICILFSVFVIGGIVSDARAQTKTNHNAIYVKNLTKSTAFYKDVMQLEVIPEPFHDGKHVWFRTGEHSQLHVIEGAAAIEPHDINTHYAYSVPDLAVFTKHLDEMHVKYGNWKGDSKSPQLRPDGIKQVYLQDPDNFWIEVNDDKF
jgi:lactoylglutathione lyase